MIRYVVSMEFLRSFLVASRDVGCFLSLLFQMTELDSKPETVTYSISTTFEIAALVSHECCITSVDGIILWLLINILWLLT